MNRFTVRSFRYVSTRRHRYPPEHFRLYGDYESLKSCCAVDMLVDLTGGVAQKYVISELDIKWDINRVRLFQELQEAVDSKALLTCSIDVSHSTMVFGVVPAHI